MPEKTNWIDRLKTAVRAHERERAPLSVPTMERYDVGDPIGEGASGVVYRAIDRTLGRPVAFKLLRDSHEPEVRERFRREALLAASLSHPNVVTVYDAGEADGRLWLAMELVPGRPFADVLARRTVDVAQLVRMVEHAALGVGAAHARGIVHRDLKPENILIAPDGEAKVGDFGLAQIPSQAGSVTSTGVVIGTPVYMAPEQARGEEVSARTDVYALGAILYEVLTGRTPHAGQTAAAVLMKILNDDVVEPRRLVSHLSRDLETIALKALERDPARRYADAAQLAEDLRRQRAGEAISARPATLHERAAKWVRGHRASAGLAAGLLLGTLVLAGVLLRDWLTLRGRIEHSMTEADAAESQGRYADAAAIYEQLRALAPAHPLVERKIAELRVAADASSKRGAAADFVRRGRDALADLRQLDSLVEDARRRRFDLQSTIGPYADEPAKRPLWDTERELDEKSRQRSARHAEAVAAYAGALGADPRLEEARSALATLHYRAFEEAESAGDAARASILERLVRVYDDGTYAPKLELKGTVQMDSRPTDASVSVYRYVRGGDGRLVPQAYEIVGTRCPLAATQLPSGSYLVILSREGMRDTRVPVLVTRGGAYRGTVAMHSDEEIGKDFLHVPAGPFLFGTERMTLHVDDFFIGASEVTSREYLEYLNDREHHTLDQAWLRSPRRAWNAGHYWRKEGDVLVISSGNWIGTWPVSGIAIEDSIDFAKWRTERAARNGERARYRLPTGPEWEKAARGVDGRVHPWGDTFDWSFTKSGLTTPRDPEPILTYPKDESPYGARDMAGGVPEYCTLEVRGGGWNVDNEFFFRCAARTRAGIRVMGGAGSGFRLVRELIPR